MHIKLAIFFALVENKHPINQIVRFKMDPPAKFSEVGSRSTTAKKVQINDVSSSSIPLTSGLRSDQISTKTMVTFTFRKQRLKLNFQVVTSPQRFAFKHRENSQLE